MDVGVVRLMGWSLVRGGTEDLARVEELVRGELGADARVAVELTTDPVETDPVARALLALQVAADDVGARLAVVEADALARERLTASGVVDVHESLDAATGSDAPALRRAEDGSPPRPLLPASGDAVTLVSRERDRP